MKTNIMLTIKFLKTLNFKFYIIIKVFIIIKNINNILIIVLIVLKTIY